MKHLGSKIGCILKGISVLEEEVAKSNEYKTTLINEAIYAAVTDKIKVTGV